MKLFIALTTLSFTLAACGAEPATTGNTTTSSLATTTTTAATTTTAVAVTTTDAAEDDPDTVEIKDVYAIVFDSSTSFEEKAPLIDDPTGLEGTVEAYAATGGSVGGVTAEVTGVVVSGDEAEVTYTLEFSGNPTYSGLAGTAIRTSDGWKVSREMFCTVMASARSACPST